MTYIPYSTLEQTPLIEAIRKFEKTQAQFMHTGAADAEPRGVFASLLEQVWEGREVTVPRHWDDWQLFSGEDWNKGAPGSGLAAYWLHRRATAVVEEANKNHKSLAQFMRHVGWL
jgi:hypothetical protein